MREKQQEKKKINTYLKFGLTLLACMAVGAVLGGITGYFGADDGLAGVRTGVGCILILIRENILWILLGFILCSVLYGEYVLRGMKKIGKKLQEAEDEETDFLEYKLEQIGSWGVIASHVLMVLSILVVATGYSMEYIETAVQTEGTLLLTELFVFLVEDTYQGLWQLRYVKVLQKIYPEKKGDPTSRKFQKQWLESCDEAEKEAIYQSSYKTYHLLSRVLPFMTMAAMICHLIWNTGILAVVLTGIIWLLTSVSYCRYCLTKKGEKIR